MLLISKYQRNENLKKIKKSTKPLKTCHINCILIKSVTFKTYENINVTGVCKNIFL